MSMHSDLYHQRFEARFSDGRTAGSTDVMVEFSPRGLLIDTGNPARPLVWPYGALATSEPLTDHAIDALVTYSYEPGATLFVPGPRFARALAKLAPQLTARAERWRSAVPWLWGTAAVLLVALVVWLANLSPAHTIATLLPDGLRDRMGRNVIASMSNGRRVCDVKPGRDALDGLTKRLSDAAGGDSRFEVVVLDWGLVNAFAAPGENIVLTRGLIEKANGPDEVAGVLAHEMGHGLEIHPETGLVRAMGLSAATELLLGGNSGTLSNVGLLLLQLSYSRDAEHEADDHALRILREAGISSKGFAGFFERMGKSEGRVGGGFSSMLSTHPDTGERLTKALRQPPYDATPSLSSADWKHLRAICGDTATTP